MDLFFNEFARCYPRALANVNEVLPAGILAYVHGNLPIVRLQFFHRAPIALNDLDGFGARPRQIQMQHIIDGIGEQLKLIAKHGDIARHNQRDFNRELAHTIIHFHLHFVNARGCYGKRGVDSACYGCAIQKPLVARCAARSKRHAFACHTCGDGWLGGFDAETLINTESCIVVGVAGLRCGYGCPSRFC